MQVLDMFPAAVEPCQKFLQNLLILSLENSLLEGLRLGIITLFIQLFPSMEQIISVLKRSIHDLHDLVALCKEDRVAVLVRLNGSEIVIQGYVIIGRILCLELILEPPVPSDITQCHCKIRLCFNRLFPAGKSLARLLVIV